MAKAQQQPDLTGWLTKEQAAERLKCSIKSIERYAAQKRLARAYSPVHGRRAAPLYSPDDVERVREELYGATPVVIVTKPEPANPPQSRAKAAAARARETGGVLTTTTAVAPAAISVFGEMLQRLAPAKETRLWIPLGEATKVSGLPRWFLEAAIRDGRLPAHDISRSEGGKHRYRVRKADLESLTPVAVRTAAG